MTSLPNPRIYPQSTHSHNSNSTTTMTLDIPDTPSDTDFPSDFPPDPNDSPYPTPTSLAPLSFLLGYTDDGRQRYINAQAENTSRLLNLPLTLHERSGLAYYSSIFYTYESYGDTLGTATGLTVGYLLRNRKPGVITNGISRLLGQSSNPKAVKLIGASLKLVAFGVAGRMYGLTSAGLQALNRIRAEQRADSGMERIVKARAAKIGALERETRHRTMNYPSVKKGDDGQSLGGMEVADQERREEEAVVREQRRAFPFGRPSEKVVELERERETRGDDPFELGGSGGGGEREEVQKGGWKNTHSSTAESTWERLRRGKAPPGDEGRGSAWGRTKGDEEPKTDSFSFSNSVEERELAKVQAQKEFDERVERERRSGGNDGYSEGDNGRKWRD